MAQRLRPTIRSWLLSLSLSLCVALTTPFKVSPSNGNGLRKRWWRWWEHDNPGPNHSGFGSAFVQWTDLLQINKSTCRNVSFLILLSFTSFFFFFCVTIMMLCYLACFDGCRIVFLSYTLGLFRLRCVTPLLLKTAGLSVVDFNFCTIQDISCVHWYMLEVYLWISVGEIRFKPINTSIHVTI